MTVSNQSGGLPLSYNFTAIAHIGGQIAKAQSDLQGMQSAVKAQSTNLQSVWAASSGEACTELHEALAHLSTATQACGTEMQAKERAFTNMWT